MDFYKIKSNNNKWLKVYKDYDRETKIKFVNKEDESTIIGEQMLKMITNRNLLGEIKYKVIKIEK